MRIDKFNMVTVKDMLATSGRLYLVVSTENNEGVRGNIEFYALNSDEPKMHFLASMKMTKRGRTKRFENAGAMSFGRFFEMLKELSDAEFEGTLEVYSRFEYDTAEF